MATVRDAIIVLIGLEPYLADEHARPIADELKRPCASWNLQFLPIGKSDIKNIRYNLEERDERKSIEVVYVMNNIDMGYKHFMAIRKQLVFAVPRCPSEPMVACESRLLEDILSPRLKRVGVTLWRNSLQHAVRERYVQLHPQPYLKVVSAA